MKRALVLCLLCTSIAVLVFAADFWVKKPYTQWSRNDAKELLSNSPWAKTEMLRHTQSYKDPSAGSGRTSDASIDPTIVYAVYVRSAQPVREALVRMAQLNGKYDQMDEAAKNEFDSKFTQFLGTIPDKIVFEVNYQANTDRVENELTVFWQKQTLETVQSTAALIGPDGKRVQPIDFWTSQGGAGAGHAFRLSFPRPQGSFAPNATMALEFVHPDVSDEPSKRLHFKFSFKDMQYKGSSDY